MPTLQDNKLDPEQQEYEKNFDFERHEREIAQANSGGADKPAGTNADRGSSWSRDNRSVREREAAPSWDTNVGQGGNNRSGGGNSRNRFNLKNMINSKAKKWAIGGIISAVLGISAAVPATLSGAIVHMKELASDWSNKNNHSLFSQRSPIDFKEKYFNADPNCNEGVKCRFKGGVTDKEIDKLKKAGLNPQVEKVGNKNRITSFNTTDVEGKSVKITADNFEDHYNNNVKFRGQMDKVAKPKSMLLRGASTLKLVFDKFGIKRNREIDGADDKERNKNFRADEYGEGNQTEKANAPPDGGTEEEKNAIAGVDSSIDEAAQQERQSLESGGFDRPPSNVPDTTNLDLDPGKAKDVASGLFKDGIKGAALGVFSAIDKACSGYQLIRTLNFGAKIYKVVGLIKYAGIFMTIADKLKAGDSKAEEIGYIGSLLFRPSSKKDSYGKTFFQSEGFNLIFQGKIADHRGLARFTAGTPFLKFLQAAQKTFESAGANKSSCKQVKSWYGQTAFLVGGLVIGFFSGGSFNVAGIVASEVMSLVFSVVESYVKPLLIQYAAGTISPDPTDPEGGYGVGNALAAGMGAFGHFTGSANGARILTTDDAAEVEMESNKEMAFMNKVDNYGKSPFDPSSSTSITTQLALAFAPAAASPFGQTTFQTMASMVTSPFSLFSSSFSKIVTGGVNAQSDISKGGEYCADEDYQAMGIAVDAFCNPIPGEKSSVIKDPKYAPNTVIDYMLSHGDVNDDGSPKSDDFQKYIRSCVGNEESSPPPISPDGGGIEVGDDVDTRWCIDKSEKFTMYRTYITDGAWKDADDASVDDTLGQDTSTGDTGGNTGLKGQTYPNGKIPDDQLCELGDAWPGHRLRCDAADAFDNLAAAFKKDFGHEIQITDSYRSYEQQVDCRARKGNVCADPGTSNHGCGQAVDFASNINSYTSKEHKWMEQNAGTYGWIEPDWAKANGSKPEPWHWEFGTGGEKNNGTCLI